MVLLSMSLYAQDYEMYRKEFKGYNDLTVGVITKDGEVEKFVSFKDHYTRKHISFKVNKSGELASLIGRLEVINFGYDRAKRISFKFCEGVISIHKPYGVNYAYITYVNKEGDTGRMRVFENERDLIIKQLLFL